MTLGRMYIAQVIYGLPIFAQVAVLLDFYVGDTKSIGYLADSYRRRHSWGFLLLFLAIDL